MRTWFTTSNRHSESIRKYNHFSMLRQSTFQDVDCVKATVRHFRTKTTQTFTTADRGWAVCSLLGKLGLVGFQYFVTANPKGLIRLG